MISSFIAIHLFSPLSQLWFWFRNGYLQHKSEARDPQRVRVADWSASECWKNAFVLQNIKKLIWYSTQTRATYHKELNKWVKFYDLAVAIVAFISVKDYSSMVDLAILDVRAPLRHFRHSFQYEKNIFWINLSIFESKMYFFYSIILLVSESVRSLRWAIETQKFTTNMSYMLQLAWVRTVNYDFN